MEEMKNNQPDEVVEQRPSTKYGRTAYQEQLRREQEEASQGYAEDAVPPQNPYQTDSQQNWEASQQNFYTQNPYQANPSQAYTPYQEPKVEVKNTFAYILMALMAVTALINFVASMMTLDAFMELQTIDAVAVLDLLAESVEFTILSYLGDMIFWVTVVFLVLDIIGLHKANHKITGAILFAIFLRPAYFIWRAHLLGKKKLGSIIYTVCYYVFCIVQYIAIFLVAFELVAMLGY